MISSMSVTSSGAGSMLSMTWLMSVEFLRLLGGDMLSAWGSTLFRLPVIAMDFFVVAQPRERCTAIFHFV